MRALFLMRGEAFSWLLSAILEQSGGPVKRLHQTIE